MIAVTGGSRSSSRDHTEEQIDALLVLKDFEGPPDAFWTAYLSATGRLARARQAVLLVPADPSPISERSGTGPEAVRPGPGQAPEGTGWKMACLWRDAALDRETEAESLARAVRLAPSVIGGSFAVARAP